MVSFEYQLGRKKFLSVISKNHLTLVVSAFYLFPCSLLLELEFDINVLGQLFSHSNLVKLDQSEKK